MRFLWFSVLVGTFLGGYADRIEVKCECERCNNNPEPQTCTADIMILADSSVCHAGIGWVRIREFAYAQAIQISDRLNMDKSDSRVGVFSFSNRVEEVLGFTNGADLPEQLYSVKTDQKNPLLGDNTDFDVMTDEIKNVFSSSSQASHRYVILITNGVGTKAKNNDGRTYYSESEIRELSNQLKDQEIRVIPVSINDPCAPEHEDAPDRNCPKTDLLQIWSFNEGFSNAQLPFSIRNPATSRIISDEILTHLDEDMADGCGAAPRPGPGPKPPKCQLADITILVDGSDSISRDQWNTQTLRAVTDWMEGYWEASAETQITVKQFSDEIRTMYGPATKNDDYYWKSKVESTEQMASSTNLHMAITDVVSDSFYRERSRKVNDLDSRFKILFVLSDGWPTDEEFGDLGQQVNAAFDIVVAVGVGDEADLEVLRETIAELQFQPAQTQITNVESFHDLLREIPKIQLDVCRIQERMTLSRKKRIPVSKADKALARSKRQMVNSRGPRPDMLNFSGECDESGFCNCKCTVPIVSIEGIEGPRGAPGGRGKDGRPGLPGARGPPGQTPQGTSDGERGPDGEKGNAGRDGSDGQPGRDGRDGYPGPDGEPGRDGPRGPPGQSGDGEPGRPGRDGEPGNDGRPGAPGQDGNPGRDGYDGNPGRDGQPGQDGNPGRPGEPGRDGQPGQSGQTVPGGCGPAGQPGQPGRPGFDGQPGQDGEDGEDGPRGPPGQPGRPGQPGQPGNKGPEGDSGECGKHGQQGPAGNPGPQGKQGDDGQNGFDGLPGPKGPSGKDGQDGRDGQPGQPGIKGAQGNQGECGMDGNPGEDGEPGEDGQPGDDGPNGADGPRGDPGEDGQKGQPGPDGRPGEADVEALYQQIKAIVKQRMGECKPCKSKPAPTSRPTPRPTQRPTQQPSQTFPLNAVFLVDGSDSIRSGKKVANWNDEWVLATRSIQQIVQELDIRYFSLVQFSDTTIDHIENFDIEANGKEVAKNEIEDELEYAQIMKGTNTYHALEHVSQMSFRSIQDNYEDRKDVLFVITDGEPRDDLDQGFVSDVIDDLNDKFDYVFVCVIGKEMRNVDYSKIQGKIQTRPIYLDDYQTLPGKLIQYFERTSRANDPYLRRIKRSLTRRSTREHVPSLRRKTKRVSKIDFNKYL